MGTVAVKLKEIPFIATVIYKKYCQVRNDLTSLNRLTGKTRPAVK